MLIQMRSVGPLSYTTGAMMDSGEPSHAGGTTRYVRGKVYPVSDGVGMALLETGHFVVGKREVAKRDIAREESEDAVAFFASMPKGARDRFKRMMDRAMEDEAAGEADMAEASIGETAEAEAEPVKVEANASEAAAVVEPAEPVAPKPVASNAKVAEAKPKARGRKRKKATMANLTK